MFFFILYYRRQKRVGRRGTKIVSEGDVPPLKFWGGRKIGEENKEKERKTRKIAKLSIGRKQVTGPKLMSFEGGNPPPNSNFLVPVSPSRFLSFCRHWLYSLWTQVTFDTTASVRGEPSKKFWKENSNFYVIGSTNNINFEPCHGFSQITSH